ncbi:MAG: hypothetical protein KatS3mg002_1037 [Candidatus Woesearchaeota archaeon]|jgi:hypothetical protein|nr:MAG: hypothetical protein KatS3mg002_1037 [Candidatus Woesearchaeota archaeon]
MNSLVVEKNIYIYNNVPIIRTGSIIFYDPLLMSTLYNQTLSSLYVYSGSLPPAISGSDLNPYINASSFLVVFKDTQP